MEAVDQAELFPCEYDIPPQELRVVVARVQPWRSQVQRRRPRRVCVLHHLALSAYGVHIVECVVVILSALQ